MGKAKTTRKKSRSKKNIVVIKVGGYIDFTTSDELEKIIESLTNEGKYNILIDLANVDYISSRGWSIFLSKIKEIRDNDGDLKLARMKPDVFQVFEVLEFFWFIKSYETLEEAVEDFEADVPPMPQ
ncbi:STAS domain-containing protein [candidate division KSB1 bacterium]|nr:STAS domain-containing protein [candidate division KSB1 bacterium]NIR71315.1 STAS domain-containing protein [candidate division KSB1 bacterium]NIS24825.1 STAS domain-containing protein [candidate division KSB1 bacterium]NIT71745.1 STAS domain-containing protein [candidate division KSB1 bacterium]NIU25460.1 STAS domain-containing protein [candidate division KSB1 bacterium]